jgi:hypothetical protein
MRRFLARHRTPGSHRVALLAAIGLLLTLSGSVGRMQAPPSASYGPPGFRPERGYFGQAPWEKIDMVNGDLLLSFTDLSLPGSAGMNLNIVRTYDKQRGGCRIGVPGLPLWVTDPDGAVQDPVTGEFRYPTMVTADGVAHVAYPSTQ